MRTCTRTLLPHVSYYISTLALNLRSQINCLLVVFNVILTHMCHLPLFIIINKKPIKLKPKK